MTLLIQARANRLKALEIVELKERNMFWGTARPSDSAPFRSCRAV